MLRYRGVALLGIMLSACMAPEPIAEMPTGKMVKVEVAFKQEADILQHTKGIADGDLCAISIYCFTGNSYIRYAYGLFNTPNIPKIELVDNQKYKIECAIVKSGTTIIGKDSKGRYCEPFSISGSTGEVAGDFINSSTAGFANLFKGLAAIVDDSYIGYKKYKLPQITKYCGVTNDFTPTAGSTLELYAKLAVFGIKPTVEGLTEGCIEVEIDGSPVITINSSSPAVEQIVSLEGNPTNIYSIIEDEYTEQVSLNVRWVRDNGSIITVTPVGGQKITVQRRYSYPLAIKLKNENQSSIITMESSELHIADSVIIQM